MSLQYVNETVEQWNTNTNLKGDKVFNNRQMSLQYVNETVKQWNTNTNLKGDKVFNMSMRQQISGNL